VGESEDLALDRELVGRAFTVAAVRDLARAVVNAGGGWTARRLKDFAARSLLLKLAAQGQVRLPPYRTQKRRARAR